MSVASRIYARLDSLIHEIMKFGVVGATAFVVNVVVFNLINASYGKPMTAKTIAVVVATGVAYAGNRFWTFRNRGGHGLSRETMLFLLVNAAGLVVELACLGVSHYLLGFTSQLADNISGIGIGLPLGTLLRFWCYRTFVFPAASPEPAPVPATSTPVLVPAAAARSDRKTAPVAA